MLKKSTIFFHWLRAIIKNNDIKSFLEYQNYCEIIVTKNFFEEILGFKWMNEWRLDTGKEGFLALWNFFMNFKQAFKKDASTFSVVFCWKFRFAFFFSPTRSQELKAFCFYAGFTPGNKGHLIPKCAVFKLPKKSTIFFEDFCPSL